MFDNINKIYLSEEIKSQMESFFEDENFIQLNDFFEKDLSEIKTKFDQQDFIEKYDPLKYKFKELDVSNVYELEFIKVIEFFKSKAFLNFIEDIVQLELNFKDLKIKKYSHKDFTLLHDDLEREDIIEVIFDLSYNDDWEESFGGILTYVTKEEEVFYLEPMWNALTILYKPNVLMKYLKYINNKAGKKNILRFEIKFDIE